MYFFIADLILLLPCSCEIKMIFSHHRCGYIIFLHTSLLYYHATEHCCGILITSISFAVLTAHQYKKIHFQNHFMLRISKCSFIYFVHVCILLLEQGHCIGFITCTLWGRDDSSCWHGIGHLGHLPFINTTHKEV